MEARVVGYRVEPRGGVRGGLLLLVVPGVFVLRGVRVAHLVSERGGRVRPDLGPSTARYPMLVVRVRGPMVLRLVVGLRGTVVVPGVLELVRELVRSLADQEAGIVVAELVYQLLYLMPLKQKQYKLL